MKANITFPTTDGQSLLLLLGPMLPVFRCNWDATSTRPSAESSGAEPWAGYWLDVLLRLHTADLAFIEQRLRPDPDPAWAHLLRYAAFHTANQYYSPDSKIHLANQLKIPNFTDIFSGLNRQLLKKNSHSPRLEAARFSLTAGAPPFNPATSTPSLTDLARRLLSAECATCATRVRASLKRDHGLDWTGLNVEVNRDETDLNPTTGVR